MAKIINSDAHCSDCIWYEACTNFQMYCKYLRKRITARTSGVPRGGGRRDSPAGPWPVLHHHGILPDVRQVKEQLLRPDGRLPRGVHHDRECVLHLQGPLQDAGDERKDGADEERHPQDRRGTSAETGVQGR